MPLYVVWNFLMCGPMGIYVYILFCTEKYLSLQQDALNKVHVVTLIVCRALTSVPKAHKYERAKKVLYS